MSVAEGAGIRQPLVPSDHRTLRSQLRSGRFESPIGFVVGGSLLACACVALLAAIVGLLTDGRAVVPLGVLAGLWTVAGWTLVWQCRVPARLRSSTAFVGVLAAWMTFIAASTVTYRTLGTFTHWDDAVFESVSGFTTTAATVVLDPESLPRATLFWRAGTQWLGGLAALLFVVAVLPSIGVGGLDVTVAGQRYSGTSLRSRRTIALFERLTGLYAGLTTLGIVLFFAGGMGPFDSVTYAATTISTGGFANHGGSFGHFESDLVEWAGIGGMALGGANMALLFRALRGQTSSLLQSFELRAYVTVIVVGAAIVALTTVPPGGLSVDSARRALFHVTSAASTTGHFVGGWGAWDTGPQVLLLAIMGVGAMSGSAGGGFRMVRALALFGYLRRELTLQLHPRAVSPVRVGRRPLGEELVSRMIGYQAQYLLVAGLGAVVFAIAGAADLVTAISGVISAIANVGPALGSLSPGEGGVLGLPRPARAALMPLMLLGRLEIAPVLVGAAVAGSRIRRRLRRPRGRRE